MVQCFEKTSIRCQNFCNSDFFSMREIQSARRGVSFRSFGISLETLQHRSQGLWSERGSGKKRNPGNEVADVDEILSSMSQVKNKVLSFCFFFSGPGTQR